MQPLLLLYLQQCWHMYAQVIAYVLLLHTYYCEQQYYCDLAVTLLQHISTLSLCMQQYWRIPAYYCMYVAILMHLCGYIVVTCFIYSTFYVYGVLYLRRFSVLFIKQYINSKLSMHSCSYIDAYIYTLVLCMEQC